VPGSAHSLELILKVDYKLLQKAFEGLAFIFPEAAELGLDLHDEADRILGYLYVAKWFFHTDSTAHEE
jgi:hypothetical protein